jgi:hypothetical protein
MGKRVWILATVIGAVLVGSQSAFAVGVQTADVIDSVAIRRVQFLEKTQTPTTTLPGRDLKSEEPVVQRVKAKSVDGATLFSEGTRLLDQQQYEGAVKKFSEALKLTGPQPDILRRLAWAQIALKQPADAIRSAEEAVALDRSGLNLSALAQSKLLRYEALSPTAKIVASPDVSEIRSLLVEAEKLTESESIEVRQDLFRMGVEFEMVFGDKSNAVLWAQKLLDTAPTDLQFLSVAAAVNLGAGRNDEAEALIAQAQANGATEASLAEFGIRPTRKAPLSHAPLVRFGIALGVSILAMIVIGLVLLGFGEIESRKTQRWITASASGSAATDDDLGRRRIYGLIVRLAGIFYFITLPIVIVVGLAVSAAVVFLFLCARRIPVSMFTETLQGFATTIKVLTIRGFRRLRPGKLEESGLLLNRTDAPELFDSLKRISVLVGTPEPDEVRLAADASISVHQRHDTKAHSVRVLEIGVASLDGMEKPGFLAILAHEMGHLKSGDTAGGWSAVRVTAAIQHLAASLPNGLYSVVIVKLLRPIWWLHHRVTKGASRFQETMADRVAVRAYGAPAFEHGLTHAIRNECMYNETSYRVFLDARRNEFHHSFYDVDTLAAPSVKSAELKTRSLLNQPTTMFDSHPSPAERFRLAKLMTSLPTEVSDGNAWDLFVDPSQIQKTMDERLRAFHKLQPANPKPTPELVPHAVAVHSTSERAG